jgi:hypothetical protein
MQKRKGPRRSVSEVAVERELLAGSLLPAVTVVPVAV